MNNITEEEYTKSNVWGILTSIDLFGCDPEIMRDAEAVKEYVVELCKLIDMKRFGECTVVDFGEDPKVSGFSMVQLIETSCVSGHFANSSNSIYIDIFSCKFYDQKKAAEFTKKFFKAKKIEFNMLLRGKNFRSESR
jgi:S-adenosylmethionine decarboxylase